MYVFSKNILPWVAEQKKEYNCCKEQLRDWWYLISRRWREVEIVEGVYGGGCSQTIHCNWINVVIIYFVQDKLLRAHRSEYMLMNTAMFLNQVNFI